MKIVDSKTGGEKTTVVNGDVVTMQHTTFNRATDSHYAMTTSFDFAGVSRDAILKLAAETLVIRWRTAFKTADDITDFEDGETIEVAAMLAKGRQKVSRVQKAQKLGLSREELLALLAKSEEAQD